MKETINIDFLRRNNLIIFECISGSKAYGTNLPESDIDIRGIFILPLEYILSNRYIQQVSDTKNDIVFYELKRFFELLNKNNPNILEILNIPEDCIIYKDPLYDMIKEKEKEFITKRCRFTFAGYAIEQIKKARGYNKKMNWEESEMKRKGVLDFCYIIKDGKTQLFEEWLKKNYVRACCRNNVGDYIYENDNITQKNFGLAKVDHAHDIYALYSNMRPEADWGIVSGEDANDIQLTSIPKSFGREFGKLLPTVYLTFNKDAYSTHCKRYSEYQTWLKERNDDRFKMNKKHGKNYDSKNLMHTFRLLKMALEIAETGEINIRRPPEEIETLMKIRQGEYEYDILIKEAEAMIEEMDKAFDDSSLPDRVREDFAGELELQIRKKRYNL